MSGVNFVFDDGAENSFEFTDEVEGGKGSCAKSMFRIDRLESDGAKTARDGRMKICANALLVLELCSLDVVGCNDSASSIGVVHGWLSE